MEERIAYRFIKPGEEQAVCELITRVFTATIAPVVSAEGAAQYLNVFAQPERMAERLKQGRFIIVATIGEAMIGAIEIKDDSQITAFFVDLDYRHKGIGRELLRRAGIECHHRIGTLGRMTANAPINAIEAYRDLGFRTVGPEKLFHGRNVIPMALDLPVY
jgi:GNAT superfamily N-acetyltransferase